MIRSGAGDDGLAVSDLIFARIDGGSGNDVLLFDGNAEIIDFTTIADNVISGVETLSIVGTGNDTITLGALDVFHFSDTPNADFTGADSHNSLVILGDAGDTVDFDDFDPGGGSAVYTWAADDTGVNLDGSGGGGVDTYNLTRDGNVLASVAVDANVSILIGP